MVAAVANANTAFFMSEASRFSRNFNLQSGYNFPRPPFAKGLA
jgi:hypothetical protein